MYIQSDPKGAVGGGVTNSYHDQHGQDISRPEQLNQSTNQLLREQTSRRAQEDLLLLFGDSADHHSGQKMILIPSFCPLNNYYTPLSKLHL